VKALVVDDEPLARRRLIRMLERMPDVEVAGQAGDGVEALEAIRRLDLDVVLLDIRMPGLDGLTLASSADDLPPIVFTTAYNEHAVDAFEVAAVDYLLKPVRRERLASALDRVRSRSEQTMPSQLRELLDRVTRTDTPEPTPVTARAGGSVKIFDPREIARFSATSKVTVFRRDGREYVLDESLSSLESRLADLGFLRVHRSELINLKHVTALRSQDGGSVVDLSDGQTATVSRRQAAELRRRLGIRST
jgi:DNA-binding LytR/AlgR family response regulator